MAINYPFGLPLKNNFAEFVYYNGLFLPHETERILNLWDDNQKIKATLSGADTYDDELRKSAVMFIENNPENEWIYNRLAGLAMQCNNERYWFDLLGFHNNLQLASYTEGDFFDWHLDFGAGEISDRKLSISMQLSDPDEYEGGDLQFMLNQKIVSAPREKGTIIVFPSFMMHRVTPITKGVRKSIVGWVAGPPYR
ncbi:2OG-Fe(II) oxygenase [Tenacibaculum caenipelagi]|uniref:PKHD-type hydroxylase n=1 Tax=Tenacibaculum caenipelagi TaxID=1325435 RepID=A0A4R6TDE7_9FLAO|nr:2OG-Fe(II) oxygenase [Tenacibaculum caenipelagi]TDQ23831.1 PKHD-type hydroxylase [Tenacibaculum caenipelagi]